MDQLQAKRLRKPVKLFEAGPVRADGTAKGPDPRKAKPKEALPLFQQLQVSSPSPRAKKKAKKSPHIVNGGADGSVQTDGTAKGQDSCKAKPEALTLFQQVQVSSQSPQAKKKAKKRRETVFRPFLNGGANNKSVAASVVEQGRVKFTKTPHGKRQNDLKNTIQHGIDRIRDSVFVNPEWSEERKDQEMKHYMELYLRDKAQGSEQQAVDFVADIASKIANEKPIIRRPIVAALSEHYTRAQVEALDPTLKISKYEWQQAHTHSKFPGSFQPVEAFKTTRKRFDINTVSRFMGYVDGFLQDHAYGAKNVQSSTGAFTQLDAVSTTVSKQQIFKHYINDHHAERRTRVDGGCHSKCKKLQVYCMKEEGHIGRHQYTDSTMLSASTITHIINNLTAGEMKSRAGLDDEDVMKGTKSIERVIEIYELLAAINCHASDKINETKKKIQWIKTYHRTGFVSHLHSNAEKCCQCISCGLHCNEEPISCPYRDEGKCHAGPCQDCEESFGIFADLLTLADTTLALPEISCDVVKLEQFQELRLELQKCETNLIHWRSHIVRKVVESKYSREQMQNLKKNQAIVVCDFKMKILPIHLRETKQQFFGKRGTACLGFMIMTNTEEKEGEVDVQFYFFFSDDTTQDSNFVLAGKDYIYSNILPPMFPATTGTIKVLFESDGAGSFNSNLAKGVMPFWKTWTNGAVEEIQIRHSVNGDGKSSLDAAFGCLGELLRAAVNSGITDITSAATCVKAYNEGAGIHGASAAVLILDRAHDITTIKNLPILQQSHRVILDTENKKVIVYSNSGYGSGREVDLGTIKDMFDGPPSRPKYTVEFTGEAEEPASHLNESYEYRKERERNTKLKKRNEAIEAKEQANVQRAKERGVFRCDELDGITKQRCRFECRTQEALDKHKCAGSHNFPSRNVIDGAIGIAARENGTLAVGSRLNRSEAYANEDVKDGVGKRFQSDAQFTVGCYRKPPRQKAKRYSDELKKDLMEMFDEGETTNGNFLRGKNKLTPMQARERLKAMRQTNGLLKYSSSSIYGPLPTVNQIKSFWYRYKESKRNDIQLTNKEQVNEWIEVALEDNVIGNNDEDGEEEAIYADKSIREEPDHPVAKKKVAVRKTKKTKGKLTGKQFVLDGNFDGLKGGSAEVSSLIESHCGAVQARLSKNVDYLVAGDNSKKNLSKHSHIKRISYHQLKQMVAEDAANSLVSGLESQVDIFPAAQIECNDDGIEASATEGQEPSSPALSIKSTNSQRIEASANTDVSPAKRLFEN